MDIGSAVPEDAKGIATVHIRSWQAAYADILAPAWLAGLSIESRARRWEEIIAANQSQTLVARMAGEVAAFVSFGGCRDEGAASTQAEIWALYVAPAKWRCGAGRALMAHALTTLSAAGYTETSLWVLSSNRIGIQFYEACSFARVPGSEKTFELGGRRVEEVAYLRRHDA